MRNTIFLILIEINQNYLDQSKQKNVQVNIIKYWWINFNFIHIIYILNFKLINLEKRCKNKQSSSLSTSRVTKKRNSNNGRNKENAIEILDVDEDLQLEQQRKRNALEQELLSIQKQKNNELEREINLIEKRNQVVSEFYNVTS